MDLVTSLGLLALALVVGTYGSIIGAGGGFVLIPALVMLFDLDGAQAVGSGTVALAVIGLTGSLTHDRSGLVERTVAAWFAAGSVPLALGSAWLLADRISTGVFNLLLGTLLLVLAVFVVAGARAHLATRSPRPARPRPLLSGGAAVGLTSGTFAIGGGLLTVPFLARVQGLPPHRAAATTQATAMASSTAAAVGHTVAGNVVWSRALVLVVGAVIGANTGARLAGRLQPRVVLTLLALGLVGAGVPLLLRAL